MNAPNIEDALLKLIECRLDPVRLKATAFAPANIELIKNWGYRDNNLNLPMATSLSLSLADIGVEAEITVYDDKPDRYYWNNCAITMGSDFYMLLYQYLSYVHPSWQTYTIHFRSNMDQYVGLSINSAMFAALAKALNQLFDWALSKRQLSILARLGDGSACRSVWPGFVKWCPGEQADGMDSYGMPISQTWPDLCVGFVPVDHHYANFIPTTEAMEVTMRTSSNYEQWLSKSRHVLQKIEQAIEEQDITLLGYCIENHSIMLHEITETATPPIVYICQETLKGRQKVWRMRRHNIDVFFTQDADPHLKLWFLEKDREAVLAEFPGIEIIKPMILKTESFSCCS